MNKKSVIKINVLNLFLLVSTLFIFLFITFVFASTITYVPPTLDNASYTNNNWIYVNTTSDENLSQALLEWGNSSGFANVTMSNSSLTNWYKNMTSLTDYTYNYTIWAQNTSGVWNQSVRQFVTVDLTKPLVTIDSPTNTTYNHADIDLKPMFIAVRESADEYAVDCIERYNTYGLSCGLVLAVYSVYQKMLESQRVGF